MTLPVPVLRGTSLLNTRRTIEGRFHLRPDPVINNCIEYALAYAANKYGILLYAHASLSNHQHTVFHDPHGKHPEFRREFHSLVTRSTNAHRETSEAKWAPDHKSPVILCDAETILDRCAYTVANMCQHDLVDEPGDWPGVVTKIDEIGGPPRIIKKPANFYDPKGELPDTVELRYVKPVELADWTLEEYKTELRKRVEELCEKARSKRRIEKRSVLGRVAVLSQEVTDQPDKQPERGTRNPRVASRLQELRIAMLLWFSQFRKEHREARLLFEAGDTGAEFPHGTYWHRLRFGVNCSATGPPEALFAS